VLDNALPQVLEAHGVRNSIVFDPDFKINANTTEKILKIYESAINVVGLG
jgi:hypothetical protein